MNFLLQHYYQNSFKLYKRRVAIEHGSRKITYEQLKGMIDTAKHFLASHGIKKGDKIAILSPVTPEAIACMAACLELGIIYTPLNIYAPAKWISQILSIADIKNIIVDYNFKETAEKILQEKSLNTCFELRYKTQFISEKKNKETTKTENQIDPEPGNLADDIAYILFTSGSTGTPKGIMISHRNAFTFVCWMKDFFALNKKDRVFSRAPLQFDLSVFDVFSTLSSGATLVIAPPQFSEDADDIIQYMRKKQVTVIYTVPSAYIRLYNKGNLKKNIPSLRLALYAGEAFPSAYLNKIMQCLPNTHFWNIYGPTETNIITYYHVKEPPAPDTNIPIGKPVHDTEIFILDENLELVSEGEIGEIVARGGTIFRGYLGNKELTEERLVKCPWDLSQNIFCRTGDLGKTLPDGSIEYHGRSDSMVKTRGYRVELDEIEKALSAHDEILQSAVVAVAHSEYTNSLHGFVSTSGTLSEQDIKDYLQEKIPSYMVPLTFDIVEDLPKTATDKIDRVKLKNTILNRQKNAA